MPADHEHPIDPQRVSQARAHALTLDGGMRVADMLRLLGDPVRVRIVSALDAADELCVGDLALALDVSDSSVSHALRLLRTAGIVTNRREGRVIWYRLIDRRAARILHATTASEEDLTADG